MNILNVKGTDHKIHSDILDELNVTTLENIDEVTKFITSHTVGAITDFGNDKNLQE